MIKERTEWRGQNGSQIEGEEKRNSKLVGVAETSKGVAEWHRLQQKNLNILGLLKRKEWLKCHRESGWKIRQSRLFQKGKEQSCLSKVPDRKEGESQGEREPHLDERDGDQSESMRRK